MLSIPTYFNPQASVLFVLGAARQTGFCHRCERVSRWNDRVDHFTCEQCGQDPLQASDTPFELNLRAFGPVPLALSPPPRSLRKAPKMRHLIARLGGAVASWGRPRRMARTVS